MIHTEKDAKQMQSNNKQDTPENTAKVFAKLMLQGKVNSALKMLDRASNLGVADLTEETINNLKKLHPEGQEAAGDAQVMDEEVPYTLIQLCSVT